MSDYIGITKVKIIDLNPKLQQNQLSEAVSDVKWRKNMLLVYASHTVSSTEILALKSQWWLKNCLQKSPVKQIRLAPELGESVIATWAITANDARKKVFLRTSPDLNCFEVQNTLSWNIKRVIDSIVASWLLLLFSPVMLGIILGQKLLGNSIFVKQWCVGRRGLLFQTWQFATNNSDPTAMQKIWYRVLSGLGLNNLPLLFNILRGELSFVGRYTYSLTEALKLKSKQRKVLNIIPGIFGQKIRSSSSQFDLEVVALQDREYLSNWSLGYDLKTLLLNLPPTLLVKSFAEKTI